MGAGQSTTVLGPHPPARALHVLRVTPSSPASHANIEAFFDFVVGFEGDSLASRKVIDAAELEAIVESHEGKSLKLLVWSSKTQDTRVVPITPSRNWSTLGSAPALSDDPDYEHHPSLLGLSMRMCEPIFSVNNVWHVLDVLEGSPAESAGLVPYGDWIIGWSGGVLSAEGDFYEVVEAHVDKPLRVYVYSYDFDTIREVVLVPNRQWGGEGLLGCVFGFGLLHRIPTVPRDRLQESLPLELLDTPEGHEQQELFVPADTASEKFDFEIVSNYGHRDVRNHDYAPPEDSTYSYSYNNRGASHQTRSGQEHVIPEYPEDLESEESGQHHTQDFHDHEHDDGDENSTHVHVDSKPHAPTPRPINVRRSPPSRGYLANDATRHHTPLVDASSRFTGSTLNHQSTTDNTSVIGRHSENFVDQNSTVEMGDEIESVTESVTDYGSLTSVE